MAKLYININRVTKQFQSWKHGHKGSRRKTITDWSKREHEKQTVQTFSVNCESR